MNSQPEPNLLNIVALEQMAMNVVENTCAIISRPVEMIIRPRHSSRYFPVTVIFFSNALMILLPIFTTITRTALSMIPMVHLRVPVGMFSIASFAKLYFLLSIIHGIGIYRLMINPVSEEFSYSEGPALPFFALPPKSKSFHFTRIVLEPAFVFIAAGLLEQMFIIQSGLGTYLRFAALAMVMQHFVSWYRSWQFIRDVLDNRYAAPVIAKIADNSATESELAQIHLSALPQNLPDDIR